MTTNSLSEKETLLGIRLGEIVRKHFMTNKDLSFYGKNMGMSIKRLNTVSKIYYGISVRAMVRNERLVQAKHFLKYSDKNIKEISYHLGFKDASYFSRYFKKCVGVTPKKFRDD